MEAALNGSREIGFTVLSMTLSLVAVFIPVLFLGGLIGRLFQEFAVTIARGDPGLGLRVAHAHADALQPVAQARATSRTRARPAATRPPSARGRRRSAWYERTPGVGDGPPRARDAVQPAASWSARSCSGGSCPKGFIPSEDTGQLNGTTETAEGTSYDAMVTAPARGRGHRAGGPQRRGLHVVGGRRRPERLGQPGPALHPPQAARPARRSSADEVAQSLTRKLAAVPGHAGVHHQSAGDQHRRAAVEEPVPVHAAELRHRRRCTTARRRSSSGCTTCRGSPTSPATCRSRTRRCRSTIDRDRASALGIDVDQIENALYNAYGARQVSTIYTPNNQYWVVMELLPQYQRDLSALNLLHITGRDGRLGAARQPGAGDRRRRAAHREPLGPAARRSRSRSTSQPGVSIGTAVDRRGGGRPRGAAVDHQHQLLGHGRGVPGRAAGTAGAARPRDPGDLPGARHPVRELRAPAHDPVGPAVRRLRRAAGAGASSSRT